MNAYIDAMRRYFDFRGRASRTEYWMFTLVVFVGAIVALILDAALGNGQNGPPFVTALAVAVRRLHDLDRTGWRVLIGIIPLGALVLLVFYCQPSTPGVNRFGMGRGGNGAQSPIQARQQANAG